MTSKALTVPSYLVQLVETMAPSETLADGRERSRISNYNDFWQKDLLKEAAVDTENRIDNYTEVVNGSYLFTALLCDTYS